MAMPLFNASIAITVETVVPLRYEYQSNNYLVGSLFITSFIRYKMFSFH